MIPSTETRAGAADWRQRIRRWLKPPRQLSFTSSGKYFVLMTLAVGFGAINTGNNLLFLLLGMMLSLIIASGILSEAVLRKVIAHRIPPQRLYAGLPAPGYFRLANLKTWASLSIEVSEGHVLGFKGPLRGQRLGPVAVPWWKFWKGTARDPAAIIASSYCLRVDPGEELNVETTYRLPRRGLYQCESVLVSTRFPFGLFDKSCELEQAGKMTVFPTPAAAKDWVHSVHAHFGDVPSNVRGHGEEFFGLREAMPGEDSRRIHWKTSARRGELVVRENEAREQRAVEISLVHCTGHDAYTPPHVERAFEEGLERLVGLLDELAARDYRIGLRTAHEAIEVGNGGVHLERILFLLATVELERGTHQVIAPQPRGAEQQVGRILVGLPRALAAQASPSSLVLTMDVAGQEETR